MNTVVDRAAQYAKLVFEVTRYGQLEPDWDGEGSTPPPAECIQLAIDFIRLIPSDFRLPVPMVGSSGMVGFYWDEAFCYADIEIDRHGEFSIYSVIKKSDPKRDSWLPGFTLASFTPEFFTQYFSSLKEEQENDRTHQNGDDRTSASL